MRGGHELGLTLIELMVGIALALLVAAAATLLLASNIGENRRLLLEARLTQDLRSAADLITRQMRRTGHWGAAATLGLWSEGAPALPNPYAALTPDAGTTDTIALRYSQDSSENNAVDDNEQVGFRLRSGVLEAQLGDRNWQALTDASTLVVTLFRLQPRVQTATLEPICVCAATVPCAPLQVQVRSVEIEIGARATSDASVLRTVRSTVRLRNDHVSGSCDA
jgi:type IV pilus assembly protein PilW